MQWLGCAEDESRKRFPPSLRRQGRGTRLEVRVNVKNSTYPGAQLLRLARNWHTIMYSSRSVEHCIHASNGDTQSVSGPSIFMEGCGWIRLRERIDGVNHGDCQPGDGDPKNYPHHRSHHTEPPVLLHERCTRSIVIHQVSRPLRCPWLGSNLLGLQE